MTGFGRTGTLFACQKNPLAPDLMALAKGMTGGYLPMAATLATRKIFDAFLGEYSEFKTFFHGHSYIGNQLGAPLPVSLRLLESAASISARRQLENSGVLPGFSLTLLNVGDIRQVGLIAGVELVKN